MKADKTAIHLFEAISKILNNWWKSPQSIFIKGGKGG
jgi:hypothetical protein